jgi:ribosomal protein L3 glutamine methyltransferase
LKPVVETLKTIRDYVRYAVSQFEQNELFYGHGTDNAWDEAVNLIFMALHIPFDIPEHIYSSRLTMEERERVLGLINERITTRKPIAYLTNRAWFAGMEFFVDERVLVPRSPIAELIENQFSPWLDETYVERIADVGTGSGCIACACAAYFPDAAVDAIDISIDALSVATENVTRHGLNDQVNLIQSNLFATVDPSVKYQLIVSNPPYVDADAMARLPQEYRLEPELGLAAGEDGLDLVIPLLQQAQDRLTEDGILVVEVGHSQEALENRFPMIPFTWLEFERGGTGVFLITARELRKHNVR